MSEKTKFPKITKLKEFADAVQEVEEAQSKAKGLREVTDKTSLSVAAEVLAEVEWVIRHAETVRLDLAKPYRDYSEELAREFGEAVSPLTGISERLQEEVTAFRIKQQKDIDAERARQQKLADRRQERENKKAERLGRDPIQHKPPEIPDAPTTIELSSGGSVQSKTVWKYEIEEEEKLPREFLQPDRGAINKAVKSGTREIPGVKIFPDGSTALNF